MTCSRVCAFFYLEISSEVPQLARMYSRRSAGCNHWIVFVCVSYKYKYEYKHVQLCTSGSCQQGCVQEDVLGAIIDGCGRTDSGPNKLSSHN